MPKSSVNASLSSYDDIFSTEESRQEEQREQVRQIPIGELFPSRILTATLSGITSTTPSRKTCPARRPGT